jgi:hypothetical protein
MMPGLLHQRFQGEDAAFIVMGIKTQRDTEGVKHFPAEGKMENGVREAICLD